MTFNILNIGYDGSVASTYADRTGYVSNGDNNDIFYFLGTNFGNSVWGNPTPSKVNITGTNIINYNNYTSLTNNDISGDAFTSISPGNSTVGRVTIEFLNIIVKVSRFDVAYRSDQTTADNVANNRILEASTDGVNWVTIYNAGNITIPAGNFWYNIGNSTPTNRYFKYLRYSWNTINGSGFTGLKEVKLYGEIKTTNNTEASRISLPTTISQLPDVNLTSPQDGDYLTWLGGEVTNLREKLYETVRTTNSVTTANNQFLPNFYVMTPSSTLTFDLPPTPVVGQFFRVRNLNNLQEVQIREPGPTLIATIGGAGGPGLTQADCYYDGTEWTVIQY